MANTAKNLNHAELKQTPETSAVANPPAPANDQRYADQDPARGQDSDNAENIETQQDLATAKRFDDNRNPDLRSPSNPGDATLRDPKNAAGPSAFDNGPVAGALRKELEVVGLSEEAIQAVTREAETILGNANPKTVSALSARQSAQYALNEISNNGMTPTLTQNGLTEDALEKMQAHRGITVAQDQSADAAPPANALTAQNDQNGQPPSPPTAARRRRDPTLKAATSATSSSAIATLSSCSGSGTQNQKPATAANNSAPPTGKQNMALTA
ncbi:MAG: hypothetical protein ABTQ34_09375 [Bdellovibrionales bacterium]